MREIPRPLRTALVFFMSGMAYFILELLWRGWSHPAMVAVGGMCFLAVGNVRQELSGRPLWLQMLLGAAVIAGLEGTSGCVLNLWLGLDIWDYSQMPGNLLGQVCPQYTALWFLLCLPVLKADSWLERTCVAVELPLFRRRRLRRERQEV